ncbi:MAG: AmmeMemoRadiSam system protein A [Bacteroidales bacterium]|nr:AmmeMemoRadiSam system protein A [Bacteroidales bacterium]
MYKPKSVYVKIAMEAIISYLKHGNTRKLGQKEIPKELSDYKQGCFVSLHNLDGSLRGCIGTIEPHEKNLYKEIIHNAISSATKDSRFEPLTEDELDNIEVSVDVLSEPERIENIEELDPEKFGIIVSDGRYRRAILLPKIKTIDTVEKQLDIVKHKAGLENTDNEFLKIYKFTSVRYY